MIAIGLDLLTSTVWEINGFPSDPQIYIYIYTHIFLQGFPLDPQKQLMQGFSMGPTKKSYIHCSGVLLETKIVPDSGHLQT